MYNYFTLLDELQEILEIFNSMTICGIAFNKTGELLLINQVAADFLEIENKEDPSNLKLSLVPNSQFYNSSFELTNAKVMCDVKLQIKRANGGLVNVNLNVLLFYMLNDVFIFQFSEMEPVILQ